MKDLIVGHYEGVLTPGQENELQTLLATSPEARALYEQHGTMQEVMEEESERLAPPIALREATIGAALGIAAETIGGGIAAWFTAKVAVAIGTVVVGGAAVGIILSTTGDDESKNPVPAVSAPATVEGATLENPEHQPPGVVGNAEAANEASPSREIMAPGSHSGSAVGANSSRSEGSEIDSKKRTSGKDPSGAYSLDGDPDHPVIEGDPTMNPQKQK